MIANAGSKNNRFDDLHPFQQLKKDLTIFDIDQKKHYTSLADLARKLPRVKVIDNRIKVNQTESKKGR